MITPELQTVLQSFLARKATEWQQYVREYPELALASYHIAPDGGYVAVEHEQVQTAGANEDGTPTGPIVRLSPACTQVITKL